MWRAGARFSCASAALQLLAFVADGEDPAETKLPTRTAPTMHDLAERFLVEHVEAKRKPATAKQYRAILDRVTLPGLGPRMVADITPADIAKLASARLTATCGTPRARAVARSESHSLSTGGPEMIAAIYARSAATNPSAIARQIERARALASEHGWDIADEHVYVDDGFSGLDVVNRPALCRLLDAVDARRFQTLITCDPERLSRSPVSLMSVVARMKNAGVRVVFVQSR